MARYSRPKASFRHEPGSVVDLICQRLALVHERIAAAAMQFGRRPEDIMLLAVSKTRPVEDILRAARCGQRAFGENYASELEEKSSALAGHELSWHFIGPVQGNKTRLIATRADWLHSLERERIARRLSEQRPADRPALNVCLQVNISGETSKSGVAPEALPALAEAVQSLPGLRLRGLMAIPAPCTDMSLQRHSFARMRMLQEDLIQRGHELDTLSMGMTDDLEAAVAEGSTMVRIGTAIFGSRNP